jgi:hypothetical protein
MSNKGDAYVIATAIYAGTRHQAVVDIDTLVERVYTVTGNGFLGTVSDEYKADLYAYLAEKLDAETTFEKAVAIIESGLQRTAVKYA